MATYKELHGTDVEVVTSDPSNPVVGQVWYNTSTDELKTRRQFLTNAWSSGGNLNTGRNSLAGCGTNTAALAFGGYPSSPGNTEIWNGTNWTETSDLSAARSFLAGAGTYTVGVAFAGETGTAISAATEEFTGASTPTVEFDLS